MKKYGLLLLAMLLAGWIFAQDQSSTMPQRTPEEEALKQTEKMVRMLGITDSVEIDTLYRMKLKYAKIRRQANNRDEHIQHSQQAEEELKGILTPAQYERFKQIQKDNQPHSVQPQSVRSNKFRTSYQSHAKVSTQYHTQQQTKQHQ